MYRFLQRSARCPRFLRFCCPKVAVVVLLASPAWAQTPSAKLPAWSEVERLVKSYFSALPDRKATDLLTRGDVSPLLKVLRGRGLDLAVIEEGLDLYLPDQHYLAKLLRTPQGKKLMREIGMLPDAYDRLARLCEFEAGRKMVNQIFSDHQGAMLVINLCLPETAKELENRWSHEPSCQNFGVRSGKIYTVAEFMNHLKTMYVLAENGLRRPGE